MLLKEKKGSKGAAPGRIPFPLGER